ncbi:hypothetical protein SISSUDRAFT_826664 [Sistotremastrum suecicum HHB10207 ss-3]|uniref:BHLH domain-containing protein n=1 Tax=Sistotremastrum suecicum HHB10207 ss-3 TaxID=1314776 RepID=A0A166CPS2_9AGAM|nr:hypothetical protein SISSUDRAFT_826664 [Sistotremastrum suecicum HHB10207 ss-3]
MLCLHHPRSKQHTFSAHINSSYITCPHHPFPILTSPSHHYIIFSQSSSGMADRYVYPFQVLHGSITHDPAVSACVANRDDIRNSSNSNDIIGISPDARHSGQTHPAQIGSPDHTNNKHSQITTSIYGFPSQKEYSASLSAQLLVASANTGQSRLENQPGQYDPTLVSRDIAVSATPYYEQPQVRGSPAKVRIDGTFVPQMWEGGQNSVHGTIQASEKAPTHSDSVPPIENHSLLEFEANFLASSVIKLKRAEPSKQNVAEKKCRDKVNQGFKDLKAFLHGDATDVGHNLGRAHLLRLAVQQLQEKDRRIKQHERTIEKQEGTIAKQEKTIDQLLSRTESSVTAA